MEPDIASLPVFPRLDEIIRIFEDNRRLLLTAEPGAGKTTLVPWKLLQHLGPARGKILLLQPRRVAARTAAERIAHLLGETPGKTVGLRTRHETIIGPSTRLEVVTEGVLVRIIQNDQALGGYGTLIFDEFHERNLTGDLALALALDCCANLRPELGMIFMSATIVADALDAVLPDIPFISVPGRSFPVEVQYHPPLAGEKPWEGAARLADALVRQRSGVAGDVLAFLPGFSEINRARELLQRGLPECSIEILHGRLSPEEQRKVFLPVGGARRIILATNVAESSVTIPGISAVVDCGLERRVRFSPRTGMDHWDTVRISAASAEQRKGRAGRLGPGTCFRWWNESEKLVPFPDPEITEADLAPLALEVAAWGAASPLDLRWLTPPPEAHLRRANGLLVELGLVHADGRITETGRAAAGMGLHPRLARMVIAASREGNAVTAALVAALVEEGGGIARASSDFRDRLEEWMAAERGTARGGAPRRARDEALKILKSLGAGNGFTTRDIDPALAGRLLLLAYPDRAAKKTGTHGPMTRWTLAGGRAAFSRDPFSGSEYVVAAEIDGGDTDGRIMLAAPVDKNIILETFRDSLTERVTVTWKGWKPSAETELFAGGLAVEKRRMDHPGPETLGEEVLSRLNDEGLSSLPWDDASRNLLARCRFAGRRNLVPGMPDLSEQALLFSAREWLLPCARLEGGPVFDETSVMRGIKLRAGHALLKKLDDWAPESVELPSGSRRRVDYETGEVPVIAARLQEFFGCADTPVIGGEPALLHLLSPAGRPVQVTRDLGGFWARTYRDVRKELLGRYPRHYWPENPMEAEPTSRAKPRKKK